MEGTREKGAPQGQTGRQEAGREESQEGSRAGGERLAYSLLKRPPEVDCHRRGF